MTICPALALIAGLCVPAQTWAQAQKIASINMQQALISTKDGEKAVADLQAKFLPKEQEFKKRQQDLQAKQDQYRKTQNTISEEAKATLERDIDTMTRGLQRDTDDAKQDMDQDQQKILQDLGGKLMQVISKYATDNQYAVVFDVSGEPNNIRFASSTTDITRDIIALYDKSIAVTPSAPPSKPAPTSASPMRTTTSNANAPASGVAAPKKPAAAAPPSVPAAK
jgi:outer membrane protein